ncbi:MAG: VPGUxxT family thioredoxin-like (seleno)protein, type 2 [Phycisphaerae bacterium]
MRRTCCFLLATVIMLAGTNGARDCRAAEGGAADESRADRPPELGGVEWQRGFDAALLAATSQDKLLLTLFQEVPGCGTCVSYGDRVLSHPLIVEAAETLFVPVAVFNNIKGADKRTLQSFNEPAWNNPVVRIVDSKRRTLRHVKEDYSVAGLAGAMVAALEQSKRSVPTYLRLLAEETGARSGATQRATFAMHCFWEGESALGAIQGVVGTMPGFIDKLEVVEVEFDPARLSFDELLSRARQQDCASRVFARSDAQLAAARGQVGQAAVRSDDATRPDKQPKYYLAQTPLKHVPMTELQACRVNAALGRKSDPKPFLSPRQLALLRTIEAQPNHDWPEAIGAPDLIAAWRAAKAAASKAVAKR